MSKSQNRYVGIPDSGFAAFEALSGFTDAEFEILEKAIRATSPTFSISKFAEAVSSQSHIAFDTVEGIIEMLTGLVYVRDAERVSTALIVDDAIAALESNEQHGTHISKEKATVLLQRLSTLLDSDEPLVVITKATQLWVEREPYIRSIRMLTDIRPIFGQQISQDIPAAMIVHTLFIEYMEQNQRKSISFAIDNSDISALQVAIERSKRKADSLRTLLESANVQTIEEQSDVPIP